MVKNRYPFPMIDDLFDQFAGGILVFQGRFEVWLPSDEGAREGYSEDSLPNSLWTL